MTNSLILSTKQTPIEIALDIDSTGHTTAKKLYEWLELDPSHYNRWVTSSITDNVYFKEGEDFSPLTAKTSNQGGRPSQDFLISAPMAKSLAMASQSPRGEETRQYFIKVENALVQIAQGAPLHQLTPAEMFMEQAKFNLEFERRMTALEEQNEKLNNRLDVLEAKTTTRPDEFYTVAGYWKLKGIPLTREEAARLGKKASALCRSMGLVKRDIPDERFGTVGIYPVKVLERLYDSTVAGSLTAVPSVPLAMPSTTATTMLSSPSTTPSTAYPPMEASKSMAEKNAAEQNRSIKASKPAEEPTPPIKFFEECMVPIPDGTDSSHTFTVTRIFTAFSIWHVLVYGSLYEGRKKDFFGAIASHLGVTYKEMVKEKRHGTVLKDFYPNMAMWERYELTS